MTQDMILSEDPAWIAPPEQPMTVKQMWATPIAEQQIDLPPQMRGTLINILKRQEAEHINIARREPNFAAFMKDRGFYGTTHYNLFDFERVNLDANEREVVLSFERLACRAARQYLQYALDLPEQEARDTQLIGRCFGNVQQKHDRTYPHYHQGIDIVLVHYLATGRGVDETLNSGSMRNSPHMMMMLDPRPVPTFPYWQKLHSIVPRVGLTVIHPGYLWHETNPFRFDGDRLCIVVNFNVLTNTYSELHRPLRF